ncbi:hypothetical protein B0A48_06923 [Cryoendolithus antarcticus]|uniref:RNA helicase n=1 Tax=Cryoendolithus antarcticus TaxID=1507870 RepID=A0A1V8T9U4_9PEZI|nr:hypothetical protein B0A48_06923 [Cryoendolithus antarcticus]
MIKIVQSKKPSASMAKDLKRKRENDSPLQAKRLKLMVSRKELPIWSRKDDILGALEKHNILVLSGETGSGKSTQIPQFLLDASWCTKCVAITQPRRVAAISLARRVAEEMGTPLGKSSPASKVGYSVRFDEAIGPSTRIKYLTEGMLLQEMLRDSSFGQYSCVIIDEVHERNLNVDLLLGFLRELVYSKRRKQPLKLVVMSATADVVGISRYLQAGSPEPSSNGDQTTENDEQEWNGFSENERPARTASRVALVHVEGRQYPVTLSYLDKPCDDMAQAALERIFLIHCKEPLPGDILVFLTGQDKIQQLKASVEAFAANLPPKIPPLQVLPLFAALPQSAQQQIFQPAPPRTRKVILATNIAETSVTVPGVRFVIDCGKAKIKHFHPKLNLDSLLIQAISRSSADQRKGRAGREAPGQCYRLYTQNSYNILEQATSPEILRCDLSAAVLTMIARGVKDPFRFPLLTPPNPKSMMKAMLQLLRLETIDSSGAITPVGRKIARLPLPPNLGAVILYAASEASSCLAEVIDIVSCLTVESIYQHIETESAREEALAARGTLTRRSGDHVTLLTTIRAYAAESTDRKAWADAHLLSHRALQNVLAVRKQLRAQCLSAKLLSGKTFPEDTDAGDPLQPVDEDLEARILKCFIRGFVDNVAKLCPNGSYKTLLGNEIVAIHPGSVLFGRKVEMILYNELVFTSKAYARGVSAVRVGWLEEVWP